MAPARRATRAGLSRKSFELDRVLSGLERPRRGGKRIECAGFDLAGGAKKIHRRALGTKLGRLVFPPSRGAQETWPIFHSRPIAKKFALIYSKIFSGSNCAREL